VLTDTAGPLEIIRKTAVGGNAVTSSYLGLHERPPSLLFLQPSAY
jgi:hypothetical protein